MEIKQYSKLLYRRTFRPQRTLPDNPTWFSQIMGYGSDDTYGSYIATYKPKRELRLLNLSTMEFRRMIFRRLGELSKDSRALILLDPDEQYSGGTSNRRLHDFLKHAFERKYDGTYTMDAEADADCEGPSEVVLFQPRRLLVKK